MTKPRAQISLWRNELHHGKSAFLEWCTVYYTFGNFRKTFMSRIFDFRIISYLKNDSKLSSFYTLFVVLCILLEIMFFISCCMLFIILAFYHPCIIGFNSLTKIGCSELLLIYMYI